MSLTDDLGRFERLAMDDGAEVSVYRAPAQGPRKGGLVLLQEIFGVTGHIRSQCDRFAGAGYEVLAPALFDREAPGLDLGYGEADRAEGRRLALSHPIERAVADATRCVEVLRGAGPVFVTGYCYGGSVAWLVACSAPGLAAAACYYGSLLPQRASLVPLCPTLAHFGRHDPVIALAGVEAFQAARPEVEVRLYPAGHGFNSDRRADYHRESAELAFQRTLELFAAHAGPA